MTQAYFPRTAIGQDHHRLIKLDQDEDLPLAGIMIKTPYMWSANSDGDVVLHAVTNAVSGLCAVPILGARADELCQNGQKDSLVYLKLALDELYKVHPKIKLTHLSISIEALRPKLYQHIPEMVASLEAILNLPHESVAITATTGEGLTGMGKGEGMGVLAILSAMDTYV